MDENKNKWEEKTPEQLAQEAAKNASNEDKANNAQNKEIRKAQNKAGKTRVSERKEYTIIEDSKHFKKGDKVKLVAPTAEVFRAKGYIK